MGRSPSEIVLERFRAFLVGDFGFIYDTYHPDSNFRQQYQDRDGYIRHGNSELIESFQLEECRIVKENVVGSKAQVIFLMKMTTEGRTNSYAERAWFLLEKQDWYYYRSQKITMDELKVNPENLDFKDFDQLDSSTIF